MESRLERQPVSAILSRRLPRASSSKRRRGFIIPWFLFGIQPLEPGWTKMSIKPAPGALTHGEFSLPTIKGFVSAHFTKSEGTLRLTVSLPLGTEARVSLPRPALDHGQLAGGVSVLMDGEAVSFAQDEAHWTVEVVPAGEHSFEVRAAEL